MLSVGFLRKYLGDNMALISHEEFMQRMRDNPELAMEFRRQLSKQSTTCPPKRDQDPVIIGQYKGNDVAYSPRAGEFFFAGGMVTGESGPEKL
jgi:hypothetical protein